jgi:hypothetical protein
MAGLINVMGWLKSRNMSYIRHRDRNMDKREEQREQRREEEEGP